MMTGSAETKSDVQGDVWYLIYPYWNEQIVSDQPNIDLKEIKADICGNQITLSIKLWPGGIFSRSKFEYEAYIMFYNTNDVYYIMSYSDTIGEDKVGVAFGMSLDGSYPMSISAELTINDDTIIATMDKVDDDTTSIELYGTAWMYEDYGKEQLNCY